GEAGRQSYRESDRGERCGVAPDMMALRTKPECPLDSWVLCSRHPDRSRNSEGGPAGGASGWPGQSEMAPTSTRMLEVPNCRSQIQTGHSAFAGAAQLGEDLGGSGGWEQANPTRLTHLL